MTEIPEGSKRAGTFTVSPGKEVYGELTLAGAKSSLYLRDKEHFNTHNIPNRCITGVLHDLTKVSLIECITLVGPGTSTRGSETYRFAKIFPQFVVVGDHHLAPAESTIAGVNFVVDDATSLFYDFDVSQHSVRYKNLTFACEVENRGSRPDASLSAHLAGFIYCSSPLIDLSSAG